MVECTSERCREHVRKTSSKVIDGELADHILRPVPEKLLEEEDKVPRILYNARFQKNFINQSLDNNERAEVGVDYTIVTDKVTEIHKNIADNKAYCVKILQKTVHLSRKRILLVGRLLH